MTSNWRLNGIYADHRGLPKRLLAETDMFAIDHTSELYTHMNANYVRIDELPNFDIYGRMLEAVSLGDYFISMGQVLLPEVEISKASPLAIKTGCRTCFSASIELGAWPHLRIAASWAWTV